MLLNASETEQLRVKRLLSMSKQKKDVQSHIVKVQQKNGQTGEVAKSALGRLSNTSRDFREEAEIKFKQGLEINKNKCGFKFILIFKS